MKFYADHNTTLDHSVPIFVRSEGLDEYIIQFALSRKEILNLQKELKHALKILDLERDIVRGKSRGVRRR